MKPALIHPSSNPPIPAKRAWLESHDRPALQLLPVEHPDRHGSSRREEALTETIRNAPSAMDGMLRRIVELERRLEIVERRQLQNAGVTRAIRAAIKSWPGPFVARDILELVQRAGIAVTFSALSQRLMHLEKRGQIKIIERGAGPVPNVYEFLGGNLGGGGGTPRGTHHPNTSGLICALRSALEDLPAEFSLEDVRRWMGEHWRGVTPKRLNAYLVALRNNGEIEIARPRKGGPNGHCQLYRQAQRFAVNGDKLSRAETAWREFRKTLKIAHPELLSGLERGEE